MDKAKLCAFVLASDDFTCGAKVSKFEKIVGDFFDKHCLFTSSGSTANHLLVETHKQVHKFNPKTVVIVPSTTWISSVTPWLMSGYNIDFCDINLEDFSYDYDKLYDLLVKYKKRNHEVILFPTALLGFYPQVETLRQFKEKFGCFLYLDGCEATFTRYNNGPIFKYFNMATTSTYYSHVVSSIEGGFLFCDEVTHDIAKMIRSHGLTRALGANPLTFGRFMIETAYPDIDPNFLFAELGTNFRNTEINALIGLMNWKRQVKKIWKRSDIFRYFNNELDSNKFMKFRNEPGDSLFCLPIISKIGRLSRLKQLLKNENIDYRPIISGNLTRHPCFKKHFDWRKYTNSNFIHDNGLYVGLNNNLKTKNIDRLISIIRKI